MGVPLPANFSRSHEGACHNIEAPKQVARSSKTMDTGKGMFKPRQRNQKVRGRSLTCFRTSLFCKAWEAWTARGVRFGCDAKDLRNSETCKWLRNGSCTHFEDISPSFRPNAWVETAAIWLLSWNDRGMKQTSNVTLSHQCFCFKSSN